MALLTINREELRDRILGCWTGKNIGGTLGGPYEGRREILDVTGYSTPAGEPLPNDDLDLQLVWLNAFEQHGPRGITGRLLGEYWLTCIPPIWNEYGICKSNLRAGLEPPISGMYRNPWKHSNGAWIRSEIWACLSPGCPDLAIRYAYEDASVDHGGGEGTFAALFTAAVQSAAFVVHDRDELIQIGLSKIPPDCRVARSVRIALDAFARGLDWKEARNLVVRDSEDLGWFQAPANVAFTMIGWLYGGGDFGRSICIATGCGDDTDCTAATLGATLGIIMGAERIPQEWKEPIGDRIITIAVDRTAFNAPATVGELTDRVLAQVPVSLTSFSAPVAISDGPTSVPPTSQLDLKSDHHAKGVWTRPPYGVAYDFVHTHVTVDYGKEPDLKPDAPFAVKVVLINTRADSRHVALRWHLPKGLDVNPSKHAEVALHHWPSRVEIDFEIVPRKLKGATVRGILEVAASGRHITGLVPVTFMVAG